MITVDEALEYILKNFHALEPERVQLLDSLDRVLSQVIIAETNVPPFNNSAMDGYAVIAQDIAQASFEHPISLSVIGDVAAGYMSPRAVEHGTAMRIMTGATLPPGADTVVRFEETSEGVESRGASKQRQRVDILQAVHCGDNVRNAGEDIRNGEVVLPKGMVIRPAEIGVLASLGMNQVWVHRRPRVAILATGDELVDIDDLLAPGKIRNSNEYTNAAAVIRAGGIPVRLGIARDNMNDLTAKIRAGLDANVDLFLSSAGVSVGDYDMVKDVLNAEGEMQFWQVKMKPGKPLAFGLLRGNPGTHSDLTSQYDGPQTKDTAARAQVPLLGLPGNPVSAMISFEVFARPAILTMLGKTMLQRPIVRAMLLEDVSNTANRRNYIRMIVEKRNGGHVAHSTGEQGSGILTSVSRANGLLVIPEDVTVRRTGEIVDVQMIDWPES